MITTEQVETAVRKLQEEEAQLRLATDRVVRDHQSQSARVQEIINNNAIRIQQINGAISQLNALNNGQKPPKPPTESTPQK
jgi:hypothetical protein